MALLFLPPAFSTPQPARARRIRSSISSPPPPPPASPPASSPDKSPALGSKKRKKKRPLRPSFEEQALHRWSARAPSQRTSFPWQQQHHEDQGTTHISDQEPKRTTSATLQSIVDYFNSSSLDSDGEGMDEDGVMHGEAVGGEESRQQRPIGGPAVHAPWMHVAESTKNQWGVELLNGDVEESGDKNGVWDQLGLVDGEGGGIAKNGNCDQMPQKELVSASLDGELYERCSVQPSNSSYGIHSVVDQGSCGNDFDKSSRKGSVSNIVETLRDSMQENGLNVALDRAAEGFVQKLGPVLLPWEREEEEEASDGGRPQKSSNADLAERTIPEPELRRLRDAALRMKERMVVGPGGVTQTVVESIHRKWKEDEVVKMRFEGPPSLNMRRTHEILEDKTGGIVIWRSGRSLVLYRGMNYSLRCVQSYATIVGDHSNQKVSDGGHILQNASTDCVNRSKSVVSSSQEAPETFDIGSFLNQLGPRYKDWSGRSPIPVDADLLPGVVPGYKPPFRLLPYKIKSSLRNREMTTLRRLARQTAPHFALGRNRQHQGLANAIVKLWEKSSIVKIAIKRGVPNTCNDRMAEEIKKLTGGVLLSRNKEYIVFYRGNDFIAPKVRQVLVDKQQQAITQQDDEELARLRASASITILTEALKSPLVAGTLAETKEAKSRWGDLLNDHEREKEKMDLALAKHKSLLKNLVRKLVLAKTKVAKAEKALAKVQEFLNPAELPTDLETVTDEERFLFRRIGLKMRAFLLLGRREVFDGTVQNMHFHWKHRELVKIIVKGKNFAQVKHIAISLEAESGGVLISLDKTTKGYAIIFYRGKNYKRPQILKPRNLLTRRQALARSIELQRREALNHHISFLQEKIQKLKSQLYLLREQMKASRDKQDAALLLTVEDDLLSDDDNIDDEGEEAYLQTYSSCDEEYADDSSNEFL